MDVRSFGRVKVLIGKKNGKYPYGNSILRIVYKKDYSNVVWIDAVEKNSMLLHLRQLIQEGRVDWDGEQ